MNSFAPKKYVKVVERRDLPSPFPHRAWRGASSKRDIRTKVAPIFLAHNSRTITRRFRELRHEFDVNSLEYDLLKVNRWVTFWRIRRMYVNGILKKVGPTYALSLTPTPRPKAPEPKIQPLTLWGRIKKSFWAFASKARRAVTGWFNYFWSFIVTKSRITLSRPKQNLWVRFCLPVRRRRRRFLWNKNLWPKELI